MKKIVVSILVVALVVIILAFAGVVFFLNSAVKRGVETVGGRLTQVEVKLQSVKLSLMTGSGKLEGLVVGNPPGYKSPSAISLGTVSLALVPRSLFADKVLVKSIELHSPEITFETDLRGNNLSKLLANLEASTGGGKQAPAQPREANAGKRLEVDDFLISGGKVHVTVTALGGQSATVNLPEIHFQNLGTGPEGITSAELSRKVLQAIVEKATEAAAGSAAQLAKGALALTNSLPKSVGDAEKLTKGLGDLLKPKK